jgi:hypothetical protein
LKFLSLYWLSGGIFLAGFDWEWGLEIWFGVDRAGGFIWRVEDLFLGEVRWNC